VSYESLIPQLKVWHDGDEHQKIVDAIENIPRDTWNYELASLYARALNNLDRYEEALTLLLKLQEEGKEDGFWYFRVGYALYYLNREAEAAAYVQKAIDHGDDGEDTRMLLRHSLEEAEQKQREKSGTPELYSEEELHCVEDHIIKYFGEFKNVFHELVSPDIHVDILVVEPTPKRNYYVLITMGMGAHRMKVPPELEHLERAELLICLSPDWNVRELKNENWYWPLRWLKIMARLPLEENSWIGWGHTVPNGEPFADNTRFTTMLLLNPGAFDEAAAECKIPGGGVVNFYQMIPIYEEELELKINRGAETLLEAFEDDALEYVRLDRRNVGT
jgi:tetratricopeptide (TPR) repeat protein